ncbi:hypothetical protein [Conexibacter woesei]|uniref:hypothetical protein n=1 Tax=Conexibacter woesei TaxID=191495 RepID=UPI000427D65D|nr:hypothetical protein [Conexibacter woesei]
MTPPARSGAASFELRRFEAAPVTGAIVVLEVEGRFHQSTRFGRPPVLVIEPGEDAGRRRIELQPVRTRDDGPRWNASYAVPAEALTADARLALGIRGTLLELPAPDEPDDGQRLTALAREANALRRRLETAEADATTARDEAAATTADRDAAVTTAREAAESAAAERISALELEVNEAHRLAASDAETAKTAAEATLAEATARATELESSLRTTEESLRAAEQRATDTEGSLRVAEQRATDAEESLRVAEQRAGDAEESLRVAEAAVAEAQEQATAEVDAPLTTEMASVIDAEARATDAERELRVAREGIAVLRAELAEERERSQAMVDELEATHSRAATPSGDEDATRVVSPRDEDKTSVAPSRSEDKTRVVSPRDDADSRGDDKTRVLRPAFGADGEDDDATRPFSVTDEADATADPPARPLERQGVPHAPTHARSGGVWIGRWIALAALVLFAIVLIALLFGL